MRSKILFICLLTMMAEVMQVTAVTQGVTLSDDGLFMTTAKRNKKKLR